MTNLFAYPLLIPVSYLVSRAVLYFALKTGFVNQPNSIVGIHKNPVAYGGGLSLYITMALFSLFTGNDSLGALVLFLLPVITAGMADDLFRFSPLPKFLTEIISVLPFLLLFTSLEYSMVVLMILTAAVMQNGWNLIDVMDGLTSGVSIIIFFSAGLLLWNMPELQPYSVWAFMTAGALCGFIFLNNQPARMFLGETGALLLGTLYFYIFVMTFSRDMLTSLYLLLLTAVPLFELFFLVVERTRKRIPFYKGSPDHFSLRMRNSGFSIKRINILVASTTAAHSFLIIMAAENKEHIMVFPLAALLTFSAMFFAYLYFRNLPVRTYE